MTNSADHLYSISRDTKFVVRVTYDGVFKFVPTGTAKTWCGEFFKATTNLSNFQINLLPEMKLLTFPFDIQTVVLLLTCFFFSFQCLFLYFTSVH